MHDVHPGERDPTDEIYELVQDEPSRFDLFVDGWEYLSGKNAASLLNAIRFPFLPLPLLHARLVRNRAHLWQNTEWSWQRSSLWLRTSLQWVYFFTVRVPLYSLWHFVLVWWMSRNSSKLWSATPAITLLLASLAVAVAHNIKPQNKLVAHYRDAVSQAVNNEDFETATILQAKLDRLQPSSSEDAFLAAHQLADAGQKQSAFRQMQVIASLKGGTSFLPAHLWIAQVLLSGEIELDAPQESTDIAIAHLQSVLRSDPKNEIGLRLIGELQAQHGQYEAGIATLSRVESANEADQVYRDLQLAHLHLLNNETDVANELFSKCVGFFEHRYDTGGQLASTDFERWAKSALHLGRHDEAIDAFQFGIEQHPDAQELLKDYRATSNELLKRYVDSRLHVQRLNLLQKLHEFEPSDATILRHVVFALTEPSIRDSAEEMLDSTRSMESLPIDVQIALSDIAISRGDNIEARKILNHIVNVEPEQCVALNNLAWLLSHTKPRRDSRALTLIDRAVAIEPENSAYHGTRGLILARMNRWIDAKSELELALNGNPQHQHLYHRTLATAHEKLGDKNLARFHQVASLGMAR